LGVVAAAEELDLEIRAVAAEVLVVLELELDYP